ncbi:MAG: hypothetical protein GY928_20375 [Colwellia sp.]|nr:hypothetical protein [Colwellia sp.]
MTTQLTRNTDKYQRRLMINFYLALTVIIASGLSYQFPYSLVQIVRSFYFPLVTFNPTGLLILDTLILFAIAFAMSHIFIKKISLKDKVTTENTFSILMFISALTCIATTLVVDYTLLKQCLVKDVYYALRFIKSFAFMSLLLLLVIQVSHLRFTYKLKVNTECST